MKKNLLIIAFFTGMVISAHANTTAAFADGFRSFYGNVENNSTIHLKWGAELAIGNKGFDVERMNANGSWQKIAFVNSGDNVTSQTEFNYTDAAPLDGKNSYRLKVTQDVNSFAYSPVISVELKRTRLGSNFQNYPNPFTSSTTIKYTLLSKGPVMIAVFDITGMQVALLLNKQDEAAGTHEISFDGGKFPPGTYVYKIITPESSITQTMIKAR